MKWSKFSHTLLFIGTGTENKLQAVHGQILHKSNMSSWGAPKCPKFIAKKYLRFTYIYSSIGIIMTWMIEEHLKTTKQIWDVELHGTDSDAIWDQRATPRKSTTNKCKRLTYVLWIYVNPCGSKVGSDVAFSKRRVFPKTKPFIPRKTYRTSNMVAQNEPIQCTKARFSAKALVALGKITLRIVSCKAVTIGPQRQPSIIP